ncbi:EmrB/QacA subfamily drug resistance transporter [Actinoplanes octamycinicus]|uniref:EmrB/QacA subfamily drug resistance transporter n=1 Tax=Actinoplanes octamycinicus TaxID=135948 RepID=A0A7W7M7V5_9ACTN|nr:MFS transporter [Actinoplanes octamycinicus]MBB4740146.1 EmrB/QacA subfamily drug resistance transporter [Actinoplanes octamycinicus]GIE59543.1 MFS transporter [Actinoplanes octamycinicus]
MAATDSPAQTNRAAGLGVLLAACVSALVVNANTSAVTILLPAISQDVGASVDTLQWAVTGYMLVGAAVIVTSGALGDVFGRRRIFLGGLVLFVLSCALIALSSAAAGVIAGRMIQGAAGSTILACGMSLLSVGSSGAGQMKAITLWGAASAVGGAAGPLIGGLLVGSTGWQGLFWIDALIAALCIPLTWFTVTESRDPDRPRQIDVLGTVLVAVLLVPLVLALSEGSSWGWFSLPVIVCLVVSVLGGVGFVFVERRAAAPLVDLQLLRNRVLVGAALAILLVAGVINALMYLLSLYFQDPNGFGMTALEAGLATLPAAAAMIAITPLITPLAVKIGPRYAVAIGFGLSTVGCVALAFVSPSWSYGAFVLPLIVLSIGLGLANGPASSASTSAVDDDQVGQASGISNMARYVGGSLAVAAAATVSTAATDGRDTAVGLADGLGAGAVLLALMSVSGVALVLLLRRHRAERAAAVHLAAAAAATSHTIPTRPQPATTGGPR